MTRKWMTCAGILLSGWNAGAEDQIMAAPLRPGDFAYGVEIQAPPPGPLFHLPLNEEVYRGVVRADLGDLRVFNAQGEVLPHQIGMPAPQAQFTRTQKTLAVFPIEGKYSGQVETSTVELKEDASGKVITVRYSGTADAASENSAIGAYLVDLRAETLPLAGLNLEWSGSDSRKVIRMKVEASDDLKSWRTVVPAAVLTQLEFQGQRLDQKRIELSAGVQARFFRVTPDSGTVFQVSSITGEFVSTRLPEVPRMWTRMGIFSPLPNPEEVSLPGEKFYLDSGGGFPVDQLKIRLPELNQMAQLRIFSRPSADVSWRERVAGAVFRVSVEGQEVTSSPMVLSQPISDRFWKILVAGRDMSFGGKAPEVDAGWRPHEVRFLGRGTPPYQLGFGSAQVQGADFGIPSLNGTSVNGTALQLTEARLVGPRKEVGGQQRLHLPPKEDPFPWKKQLLWGALLVAVLLISRMAWSLYREMGINSDRSA